MARRIWRRHRLVGWCASSSRQMFYAGMAVPRRSDRRFRSATFVVAARDRSSGKQSPPAKSKPQRSGSVQFHRWTWCGMAARQSCSSLRRRCTWSLPACSGRDVRRRAHRRAGWLSWRWQRDRHRDGRDRLGGAQALRGRLRSKQADCRCRASSQRMSGSTGRLRQTRSTRDDDPGHSTASTRTPTPAKEVRGQEATSALI